MRVLNSFIIAFSMYSRIPMPETEWTEENMRYAIAFFPFVGAVIGFIMYLWFKIAIFLEFNDIMRAALSVCIPVIITGGIHMDGFCDTTDALSSHQTRERKLEILKDSNSGAFAIIKCCLWFFLYFAAFTQISEAGMIVVSVGFVISRSLSGISVMKFKQARSNGMAASSKRYARVNMVVMFLGAILVLSYLLVLFISPILGFSVLVCSFIVFIYYRWMSYRQFGGVTGDLAGYFLVLCELSLIYSIVFTERILILWN